MPIIYLFGPDGSGKSTLSRLLVSDFRKQGFRAKSSWMRGSHTFISVLSRFLSRFDNFRNGLNPYYGIRIPRSLIMLWYFLEYVSSLPAILLKFVLPSFLGSVVIADRYVLDLVVWVVLITDDDSFLGTVFARHLALLALRTEFRFFVVADLETLAARSGEEPVWLNGQLHLYKSLGIEAYTIDTTRKNPEESLKEIMGTLKRNN
jgi:thymidylate kinase